MTTPVTPVAGATSAVVTGGTPVTAILAGPGGGFITNPLLATDQAVGTAEVLFINPVGPAGTVANGNTFALQPGQTWKVIPGQTTPTSVNAVTSGHKFSVVSWT